MNSTQTATLSNPVAGSRQIAFAHARPAEVLAARESSGVLWLPMGPLEWHGPHLPFGVDPLNAEATAVACARRMGGLVLPTLYCGTERERGPDMLAALGLKPDSYVVGMDFPAHALCSGYFPEEEFALQVRGWIERARAWHFSVLVIVNGHGAQNHNAVIERLVHAHDRDRTGIDVLAYLALVASPSGGPAVGQLNVGHAAADETSLMMLDHPEDVDLAALPDSKGALKSAQFGIVDDLTFRSKPTTDYTLREEDDPRWHATLSRGQAVRGHTVDFICWRVREFLRNRGTARTNLSTQI